MWEEYSRKTLKDFLTWYNNKDVAPFLLALEKQTAFYQTLGLDMLNDAFSVPGLTLRYLFKTLPSDTFFSLIHENNKDLHELLRTQMVGGPSIIFHRYHEKKITRIRGDKTTQSLVGYDVNAFYLWSLMQDMPTEHPIRRRKENGFKAENVDFYGHKCREWLEWTMDQHHIHIQHKFNNKEHALGRRHIRVDGWDVQNKTVYQFHGCLFHGHDCDKTRGLEVNRISGITLRELRKKHA